MKKILIIDDDLDMRTILTTILEGQYETKQVASRQQATEILEDFKPDLVVLDVMMEEHDSGFELAREIKDNQALGNIKILMTTNIDNEMHINFKKEAGNDTWLPVDDYVVKPINASDFLPKIQKLLEGQA